MIANKVVIVDKYSREETQRDEEQHSELILFCLNERCVLMMTGSYLLMSTAWLPRRQLYVCETKRRADDEKKRD